jgi:hypothetical protein
MAAIRKIFHINPTFLPKISVSKSFFQNFPNNGNFIVVFQVNRNKRLDENMVSYIVYSSNCCSFAVWSNIDLKHKKNSRVNYRKNTTRFFRFGLI